MAPKKQSKKQQKRGIDFKKIKRKIGRKLPPPKSATNTEIKSKAIVLPEQSVASEKAGLAVNKKGLTLKELLQQTSHYSWKVRKDALLGIKDLFHKHPEELRLHKYAVIEKLRERIGDDVRLVRETLYQLFESVIFPGFTEDNQELFVSLMMAYIFNSMTHLAIDVRLMAFKFLELVIQYYPPSFFLYAEKILQNYEDILRKNQFFLEDKNKLKTALSGLERCLLLLPCNKKEVSSCEVNDVGQEMLHAFEPDVPAESAGCSIIIPKLKDLVPVLVNCFQDFMPAVQTGSHLDVQSFNCMLSILNSINHTVRFFVYMTDEGTLESRPSHGELDLAMLGGTISMTLLKKLLVLFPLNIRNQLSEKDDVKYFVLDSVMTEIFLHLSKWICPPGVILEKFLEFLENALLGKICSDRRSGKATQEKHLISLLPFIPKLVSQVAHDWKSRLLQAFTNAFKDCHAVSSLKLACLSAMEEMVVPRQGMLYLDPRDPEILNFQIAWIRELPVLLILLGDKNSSYSQVVLHLLLRLGQRAFMNYFSALEYDNISLTHITLQFSLQEFFCIHQNDGTIKYGPFVRLPRESQELTLCCLRYISTLDSHMLKSIVCCCLCPELEQSVLVRIIEILHSAYKSGHIQIADHISFFITMLSRFRVFPENVDPVIERDVKTSNRGTFKSITSIVCSCLSQMGDSSLVFNILEKVVLDQMSQNLPLDNVCAMLRILIAVNSKETIISEQAFVSLVECLPRYLINIVHCIAEDDWKAAGSISSSACCYYLVPCFFLFVKSHKLLGLVLKTLGSWINDSLSILPCNPTHYETDISSRVEAISLVLLLLRKDDKVWQIMSLFKAEIDSILQSIISVESSEEISMTLQEKYKVKCAHDRLKDAFNFSLISTFFKPSSSSVPPKPADPPPISDDDEGLSIWENKQHQYFSTYKRRRPPNPQRVGSECSLGTQLAKKPTSNDNSPNPLLGKAVTKNKKRSYAPQYHLDLGQSDFLLHTCSVCGLMYVTGDEEDEKAHKGFHNDYTRGIQFKGWSNERVVHEAKVGGGRILLVLDSDPPAQRNKVEKVVTMMETELGSGWILPKLFKVYLFVLSARIVGCLVAEPITKAHKVLSGAVNGSSSSASTTTNRTKLTTLEFGKIKFHRDIIRKAPSAPEPLNECVTGAMTCEEEAVPAVCGIRAIWVTPANRRKRIATQLLDALRKSFCTGFVLEHSQLAFSQLTSAGNALVSNYIGDEHFLVYNTNNVVS